MKNTRRAIIEIVSDQLFLTETDFQNIPPPKEDNLTVVDVLEMLRSEGILEKSGQYYTLADLEES